MSGAGLIVPDGRLLDARGQPMTPTVTTGGSAAVGLDLYAMPGGTDTLTALATIADLRRRRITTGIICVEVDQVTAGLLVEIALFNREAYLERELDAAERAALEGAVRKKFVRTQKAAAALQREHDREDARRAAFPFIPALDLAPGDRYFIHGDYVREYTLKSSDHNRETDSIDLVPLCGVTTTIAPANGSVRCSSRSS